MINWKNKQKKQKNKTKQKSPPPKKKQQEIFYSSAWIFQHKSTIVLWINICLQVSPILINEIIKNSYNHFSFIMFNNMTSWKMMMMIILIIIIKLHRALWLTLSIHPYHPSFWQNHRIWEGKVFFWYCYSFL